MKHLVNVSGGAASAVCLFRVIDRYGIENVSARLADTNSEHPDLYRFVDDLERVAGISITRLSNGGKDIWDVFFERMMWTDPGVGGCVASYHLKKVPLKEHAASIGTRETIMIHVGFGPDEDDRVARLLKNADGWKYDFPLMWKPTMWRCDVIDELRRRGIEECSVYKQGYPHANCLKFNCVLAGIGQWAGYLKDFPDGYAVCEAKEEEFMAELARRGRTAQTILRDRRGGQTTNLSLRQLREEIQAGTRKESDLPAWRESSCSCMGDMFS